MLRSLCGVAALAVVAGSAQADVIGFWSFNNNQLPGGGFGYLADPSVFPLASEVSGASAAISFGGGLLSETLVNSNGDTVYTWLESFGGTTINAPVGVESGGSISIEGGTVDPTTGPGNNGAYFQIALDMSGLSDLQVSYATRGTGSGFSSQTWSWSTDGVNFTNFSTVTGTNVTSYFLANLGVLNALDGAATAFLRVTFAGATTASGNNRLDNLTLSAIPAPGAIALLGVAGLAGSRRRRG